MWRFTKARAQAIHTWVDSHCSVPSAEVVADARVTLDRLIRQEADLRECPDVDVQLSVQHALAGQRLLVAALTGEELEMIGGEGS